MAKLVKTIRASIESDTGTPPPFNVAAARELYDATLGGLADGMKGMTALSVAPAGPLLSVPFERGNHTRSNGGGATARLTAVAVEPADAKSIAMKPVWRNPAIRRPYRDWRQRDARRANFVPES